MAATAEESEQVKRARRKLLKRLEEADKLVTPNALAKMSEEIHLWISRNIQDRVDLREKNISLFDENQNVANIASGHVNRLKQSLRKEFEEEYGSLKGRVKRREKDS